MRAAWKRIRYRLEWFGLASATKLIPLLPRRAVLALADLLGGAMFMLDRQGRRVALANLEAAFGDTLFPEQRNKIARESFRQFARTMLDLFWSARLTKENFSDYVEFGNLDEIKRATGPEGSLILACFHYSNFEWLGLAFSHAGLRGTIISQEFKNSLLDPVFKGIRERFGHTFVPRERGIIRLYKALRRKGRTALFVDLTVKPDQGAVPIECFGLKTSVTSAHAWLSDQTGTPILPSHCEPLPDGRYRIVVHRKIETEGKSMAEIAQACWDSFEPIVRKNPAPWLWMYKHWRYRPAEAGRAYPFYAHFYEAFDGLVKEHGKPKG